jgi:hypothetical protein
MAKGDFTRILAVPVNVFDDLLVGGLVLSEVEVASSKELNPGLAQCKDL